MAKITAIIIIDIFLFLSLVACGKDGRLKRTEYYIGQEWRACSFIERNACGESLRCGDDVFSCMVNVQVRVR